MPSKIIYEKLLAAKKTTAAALEKDAGLYRKTVSNAMLRDSSITVVTAQKIVALYPDIRLEWLMTGEGSMYAGDSGKLRDGVRQVPYEDFMVTRVLTREARMGYLSVQGDPEYKDRLPTMLVPREYEKGDYLVIEAVGTSMDDGTDRALLESDKFLCKEVSKSEWRQPLPIKKYLFAVGTKTEVAVIKQITEQDFKKGMLMLHSWNPGYEDYPVFMDDITEIYIVKKLVERQIRL